MNTLHLPEVRGGIIRSYRRVNCKDLFAREKSSKSAWPSLYHLELSRGRLITLAREGGNDSIGKDNEGPNFEKVNGTFRVRFNNNTFAIPEQTVIIAGLAMLGLGAVIGPIVIGLTVAAVSIGVTLSMGAFAVSTMFLPLAFFMLFFMLTFGGVFGSFALLGMGVFMPKMLSFVITGAGLAIGWTAVRWLLPKASTPKVQVQASQPVKAKSPESSYEEEEVKRASAELRDFDQLLADREHRKRVDKWKS